MFMTSKQYTWVPPAWEWEDQGITAATAAATAAAAAAAASLQSCLTLCDPIDSSPPGSSVPGILQARTLEWVAISFSSAWNWKVKVKSLSRVHLLATPWTATYQAPPSMGFARQEYWSGVPLPSPHSMILSQISPPSKSAPRMSLLRSFTMFSFSLYLLPVTCYLDSLGNIWGR